MEFGGTKLIILDLETSANENSLDINIYRKPTFTDTIIPYSSTHPFDIKMSAFHSMLNHLPNTPISVCNYKKELHTIKTTAVHNGYEAKIIDRL